MKLVTTEIFMGKIIEVFQDDYAYYFAKIDGKTLIPRGGGVSSGIHTNYKKAVTSAKISIRKNMNEIAKLEVQIAELQAKLEVLKNA